ncbi:Fimbrial protein [compost metagenome]
MNGLLNLTDPNAAGTAQAVKVQILNNGTPVTFDKLMHIGTQDSSGTFDIPLTAQYYRSAGTLKAGTANSSATYTISYE